MTGVRPRICVLGSINMDLVVRSPRLPRPGETVLGGPFETFPGGKGANQAVAAARLGAQVAMIGCVGADTYGRALRDGLAQEGVDVPAVLMRPGASGVALITVDEAGEDTIVVAPGANHALAPDDVDAHAATICGAQMLLMQLEVPLPVVARAAMTARAAGVPVLLNAAPAMDVPAAVLRDVDVLVVNRAEAAALVGHAASPDLPSLTQALLAQGPRRVIVTLGERGCVQSVGASFWTQAAFPICAVDATAAGDAFVGALAVALCEGAGDREALRFASAAGALACTRRGAQPSLPVRGEVEGLLVRHGS